MDAQTEFAAEIFKTLAREQKDAILDLVSKIAAHEKGLYIPAAKQESIEPPPTTTGRPVHTVYRLPQIKARRKFTMAGKKPESAGQEAVRLISEMSDKQIMITFEACKIQAGDETKTPEECVMLARERLSKEEKR